MWRLAGAVMVWAWAARALAGEAPGRLLAAGDHDLELRHRDRLRTYVVHVPPQVARGAALPLVLSFHGAGANARDHQAWTEMDRVADREGFVTVYPDGTGLLPRNLLTWNAGTCCGYAHRHGVDDVGFVLALLAGLSRRLPLDPTRLYATGMSNGAMMSYRLAVEATPRLAAVAPVAGTMVVESFTPSRPMPVMHFHSVDDPRAPYDGGYGPFLPFLTRVLHPSVEETIGRWIRNDGCPGEPRTAATVRVGRETDAQAAQQLVYGPCFGDSEVVLWKLSGVGHVWPGAAAKYPQLLLGPPTRVVDASEAMWRFFTRFSRPDAPPLDGAGDVR
jgi:polyhydroxybutyrate depolymerase